MNIHNRTHHQAAPAPPQPPPQLQQPVSLGALPSMEPAAPRLFALGAGDGLGRSVFARYAATTPSQRTALAAASIRREARASAR